MGLFDKLSNSFHEWVHEDETSIFESPPPDNVPEKKKPASNRFNGLIIEGESVAVQKIKKLICDSINNDYFDIDTVRIVSGIIDRLAYPLSDKAVSDLFAVLNLVFVRNYEMPWDSSADIELAKQACLSFLHTLESRNNDGLGEFRGKSFALIGTFKYGTHCDVSEALIKLGCTPVKNHYSENYADYTFIGCKTTQRHPSEDFTDLIPDNNGQIGDDGFSRLYILERDCDFLKKR